MIGDLLSDFNVNLFASYLQRLHRGLSLLLLLRLNPVLESAFPQCHHS